MNISRLKGPGDLGAFDWHSVLIQHPCCLKNWTGFMETKTPTKVDKWGDWHGFWFNYWLFKQPSRTELDRPLLVVSAGHVTFNFGLKTNFGAAKWLIDGCIWLILNVREAGRIFELARTPDPKSGPAERTNERTNGCLVDLDEREIGFDWWIDGLDWVCVYLFKMGGRPVDLKASKWSRWQTNEHSLAQKKWRSKSVGLGFSNKLLFCSIVSLLVE